ncbi:hypothetical protein [Phyllobacterium zundukense]|uniref:hypothetical protein n=1 Tax=Phyllobacterium zundukense TaxID=1867719 RepID=UPI0012FFFF4A|nr:hypothetical protein [Phyllobacterium zundukense]
MSEPDRKPVTLAGILSLTVVALIFLAIIWLIGAAFARTGIAYNTEQFADFSVVMS